MRRNSPAVVAFRRLLVACAWIALGVGTATAAKPGATLNQARNGTAAKPKNPVLWVTGDANATNSHFAEGHSMPFRLILKNLPLGAHTVHIAWDIKHSGKHAYDYITHFQRLLPHSHLPDEIVNPLLGLAGTFSAPNTYPIPAPSSAGSPVSGQPTASFGALPAGARVMTIYNGSISGMAYVSEGNLVEAKSATEMRIEFTASSPTVVFAWGGHIASAVDWGEGMSAGGISGAPYHTRLISLDGKGGNMDRSLHAPAVAPAPTCGLAGPDSTCAGDLATFSVATSASGSRFDWSLGANSAGAEFVGGRSGTSIVVRSTQAGSYTVSVLIAAASGSRSTCDKTVAVLAAPDVDAGPPSSICSGTSLAIGGAPTAAGGAPPYTHAWMPAGGLDDASSANPIATPTVTTTYTVAVTDANGCTASASTTLHVQPQGPTLQLLGVQDQGQYWNSGILVRIPDPSTGQAVLVGPLGYPFILAEGMASRLGTSGLIDDVFVTANTHLVHVDPVTGVGTDVGAIGFSHVDGIAFHPQTGVLYGMTWETNQLLTLDMITGQGTLVANGVAAGHRINDLAFHPDGRAFIITDDVIPSLLEIDITTGATLNQILLDGGTSMEALLWSLDGSTLYSTSDRGSFKDVCTIDIGTGQVTFLSSTLHSGWNDIEGLAWYETPPCVTKAAGGPQAGARGQARLRLHQNAPNPFNPTTWIDFELPQAGPVELAVYDVAGRRIATLLAGAREAGRHRIAWSGRTATGERAASGIYYYALRTPWGAETRRMVLIE